MRLTDSGSAALTRRAWLGLAAAGIGLGPRVVAARAVQDEKKGPRKSQIIAFVRNLGGQEEITGLIGIGPETGAWNLLCASPNGHTCRLSPDGTTLAYSDFADGKPGLWTCDLAGDKGVRQILELESPATVCWSPDGKQLIISNLRPGPGTQATWPYQVRRMNPDGSNAVEVTLGGGQVVLDVSPDGKWYLTAPLTYPDRPADLVHPDGKGRRPLFRGPGSFLPGSFSPDGREVVYSVYSAKKGGSVWAAPVSGGEPRQLPIEPNVRAHGRLSPDGKQLALQLTDLVKDENGDLVPPPRPRDIKHRIEVMDSDGKNRRDLHLPEAQAVYLSDWR